MSKDFIFLIPRDSYNKPKFKNAVKEFIRVNRIRQFRFVRSFDLNYIKRKIASQKISGIGCFSMSDLSDDPIIQILILKNSITHGISLADISNGTITKKNDKIRPEICLLQYLNCINRRNEKGKLLREFYLKYLQN